MLFEHGLNVGYKGRLLPRFLRRAILKGEERGLGTCGMGRAHAKAADVYDKYGTFRVEEKVLGHG